MSKENRQKEHNLPEKIPVHEDPAYSGGLPGTPKTPPPPPPVTKKK